MKKNEIKKMIVIKGAPKSGKNSTIKKLVEIFGEMGKMDKCLGIELKTERAYKDGVYACLEYKDVRIGILSIGDPSEHKRLLDRLVLEEKCNIIVVASRNAGKTYDNVHNIRRTYGYDFSQITSQMDCWQGDPLFDAWYECFAKCIITYINEIICKNSSAD
jgi:hypothetical protein